MSDREFPGLTVRPGTRRERAEQEVNELTPEELVSAIADLETAEACEASKFRDEVDDAD